MSGITVAGRLAFVSGGASGIGRAIAEAIVAKGGRVAIADVDQGRAQAVVDGLGDKARAYGCDVRDHAAVSTLADRVTAELGSVDIAFANAGIALNGPVLEADPDAFDRIFAVNVKGVWNVASVFGRKMIERGSGYLCLTGSEHSFGLPHPGSGIYTATKHAVIGIAEAVRSELPDGVGISVLCPGLVSTELYDDGRYDAAPKDDPSRDFRRALLSYGVDPSEVAAKALAGVERGDFIIPTHGHSRAIADRRYAEINAGFAVHAPNIEDADKYDVNLVAAAMMTQMQEGATT
jgi:NAD(P)-dependent dehydrogenase (short-subunit alcohol dehydrogenase family)